MDHRKAFADLIARVRSGEADAANDLAREYLPAARLASQVYGRGGAGQSRYDSEDLAQSAFLRLFVAMAEGRVDFQTPEELAAWLAKVARNRRIDRERNRVGRGSHPRPAEGGDPHRADVASPEPDPADLVAEADLFDHLTAALPESDREIVLLWMQGLSWPEIAARVGCGDEAARKRWSRAIQKLRTRLPE